MRLKKIKKLLPYLLSFIIILILLQSLKLKDLTTTFEAVSIKTFLIVLLIYSFTEAFNSYRYKSLYSISKPSTLIPIMYYCNMMVNILPLRLGEFSFVSQLKKHFSIDKKTGLNKLVIVRIFDYIVVYFLFLLSSFYIQLNLKQKLINYISILFICSLIFGLVFFLALRFSVHLRSKLEKQIKPFAKVNQLIDSFFIEIKSLSISTISGLTFLTVLYWLSRLFLGFYILHTLGISLGFLIIVFISLAILLVNLLPINTFAGFGVFEVSGVALLSAFGYDYQKSLSAFLNFHILILIPTILLGVISAIVLKCIYVSSSGNK